MIKQDRLGFLSGTLYEAGTPASDILECARVLRGGEDLDSLRTVLEHRCSLCAGHFACRKRMEDAGYEFTRVSRSSAS